MACMRGIVHVFVGFWDGDYVSQLPYVWYNNNVYLKSNIQTSSMDCTYKLIKDKNTMSMCK